MSNKKPPRLTKTALCPKIGLVTKLTGDRKERGDHIEFLCVLRVLVVLLGAVRPGIGPKFKEEMTMHTKRFLSSKRWTVTIICSLLCMGLLVVPNVPAAALTGASGSEPTPVPPEIWLTEENNGQRIELVEDQLLGLKLRANPSTGYRWDVIAVNESILQQVGKTEFEQDSLLPGAPARQIFRFKVVGQGEGNLGLFYRRPWVKDEAPAGEFSVQVSGQAASSLLFAPPAEKGPAGAEKKFVHLERPAQATAVEPEPKVAEPGGPVELPGDLGAWTTLMTEGFEGAFPGTTWTLYGDPTWDDTRYKHHTGSWSGYCVKGGSSGVPPPGPYPNNADAWMVYGPFDLSNARDAELLLWRWQKTESNHDYLGVYASVNGWNFYGVAWSGDSGGWVSENFDLTNVYWLGNLCGYRNIWIAFVFQSDSNITYQGAYLDDIVLRKTVGALPTLPSTFDWRSSGGVTPVKDQENCGSCWAFSTVGAFESRLKIKDGITKDLSEQYLVSCNIDGWSCDGGWFAHDYHQWKYSWPETTAGAVLESAFPYVADDVPCGGPYSHPYKINSWSCLQAGASKPDCWTGQMPNLWDIKRAIMTRGPVAVTVYVGPEFGNYTSGVFETDEYAATINHAVVLVGWDDTQGNNGVWFLRNSWNTTWGENGYMRIGYGISSIGFCTNYIVYKNAKPTNGTINPSSGSALAGAKKFFTTKWNDADGWRDLKECLFHVGTSTVWAGNVSVKYDPWNNKLYLRNDAGTAWVGGYKPGSSNVIENSRAKVHCADITITRLGNQVSVQWAITFKSTFRGAKQTYLKSTDVPGATRGWQQKGSWTIQ